MLTTIESKIAYRRMDVQMGSQESFSLQPLCRSWRPWRCSEKCLSF